MAHDHPVERLFDDLPARMARLPRDKRGFPVPNFVSWESGEPDFRVVGRGKVDECLHKHKCWICGDVLGRHLAFVVGAMCVINRVTSEPPSHRDCAIFAAKNCPFLSHPMAKRRLEDMPEESIAPPGVHLDRNPGAMAVWISKSFRAIRVRPGEIGNPGRLFAIGDPEQVLWFAKSREATRAEIEHSITTGLPALRRVAWQQGGGAVEALELEIRKAAALLPREEEPIDVDA